MTTKRATATTRRRPGMKHESLGVNIANYLFAAIYGLAILIPLYYLVVSSFKANAGIFLSALSLPSSLDFSNYVDALEKAQIVPAMVTSFGVVIATQVSVLTVGFMAAYAIARVPARLATWTEGFFGIGFLIPTFALLIPIFLIIAKLGLLFNPLALVIVYVAQTLPFTVLILASVLRHIPDEFEEAARLDGASHFRIMWNVMFPLARSGVVTVAVIQFLFVWNEFIFAIVLLGQDVRTVQIAIPLLKGERLVDFGLLSAGLVISIIPVFIIFAFFQEKIVSGLTTGGVKG